MGKGKQTCTIKSILWRGEGGSGKDEKLPVPGHHLSAEKEAAPREVNFQREKTRLKKTESNPGNIKKGENEPKRAAENVPRGGNPHKTERRISSNRKKPQTNLSREGRKGEGTDSEF